jgi:DNA (cytosine-5)-methyltransferase 1
MGRQDFETETLIPTGGFFSDALAFAQNSRGEVRLEGGDGSHTGAISHGGGKPGQGYPAVAGRVGVRRLTPTECERLQGFPDSHTLVEHRGKMAADGPRYKAIGNSMAVPVMRWIGKRIKMVNELKIL